MNKKPHIEFEGVCFGYPGNPVLESVSFTVDAGSYVGIIGPNGGGKTTVIKLILGLLSPHSGKIRILGQPLEKFDDQAAIGYVPQHLAQANVSFPATVQEIVESGRTPLKSLGQGLSETDRHAVKHALEAAGITALRKRLLGELSGGERQRVLVARALASEPKILILDEPFEGVDPKAQHEFYDLLDRLNRDRGMTILFVTHDVDVISKEAGEIICLNRRLVCQGTPDKVVHGNMIERLYGKKVVHTHHHDSSHHDS